MKILLTITARTTDPDGTTDTAQSLHGFLRESENSLEITYREASGEESLGNTRTALRVFADHAELSRQGDYSGLLIIEPGCTHTCEYITPFGALPLEVTALAMHSTLCPDGTGELTLCYDLAAGGPPSHHELHLSVQPV